jgi:ubiquitin carboxyl-terminal hydrolase 4/11/15
MADAPSVVDPVPEHEIDAYMAEQGEDLPLPEVAPTQPPPATTLSLEQKAARIKQLCAKPMVAGETWYVMSRHWFRRWEIACGILSDKAVGPLQEQDIGPPDNSSLFDAQGNLTSSLVEKVDVEFLPQEAWSELVAWCVSLLTLFSFIHHTHFVSGMVSQSIHSLAPSSPGGPCKPPWNFDLPV